MAIKVAYSVPNIQMDFFFKNKNPEKINIRKYERISFKKTLNYLSLIGPSLSLSATIPSLEGLSLSRSL